MPRLTRRRALQGAVGLAAGLAGCPDGTDARRHDRPTPDDRSSDSVATDPEYVALRTNDYEPGDRIAWFTDPDATASEVGTVPLSDRLSRGLVADEATAATLAIDEAAVAETEVSESADAVRTFVGETDFERETLLVEHVPVPECYRVVLCHLAWSDGEMRTQYARRLRDSDVACEADARSGQVTFARVPTALDPSVVDLSGMGFSNGECRPPPGERGRATPRPDSGTADATTAGTDGGDR